MQELVRDIEAFKEPIRGFYTHSATRVSDNQVIYFSKKSPMNINGEVFIEYTDIQTTSKGNPSYRGVKVLKLNSNSNASPSFGPPPPQQNNNGNFSQPARPVQPTQQTPAAAPAQQRDSEMFLTLVQALSRIYPNDPTVNFDNAVSNVFNKAVELLPKVKRFDE